MNLKERRAGRARIATGAAVASLALLGSGLVAGSAAPADPAKAPAAAPSVPQQSEPMKQRTFWGAIKLAKDGTTGKANNRRTKKRALRAAARKCRAHTRFRCNVGVASVERGCAAIAFRMRGGRVVASTGIAGTYRNKRHARQAAKQACRCRKAVALCTRGRG